MSTLQSILDKDTYKAFLHRLDARALLEHYGAQNMTEQVNFKDGSTEIVHSCLLDRVEPHHTNGDANPSASCNIDSKTYVCYAMGFGCDLFHLVMKLEGRESLGDSMGVIGEFLLGATMSTAAFREEIEKAFTATSAYTIDLPSYGPQVLKSFEHPHVYWNHRGITHDAQRQLQLGYDSREKRIVFPHFVNATLVGWQKRVVPGETCPDYPKYKNSPGFPKSETLYHLDQARKYESVVVVESPMSVAKAVSEGLPNVVATFGAKVSQHQLDLLTEFSSVFVWFDRDAAGIGGEKKLVEGLYRHAKVRVVAPDRGKDMGDCSHDEMVAKLYDAVPAYTRLGLYDLYKKMR